MQEPAGATDGNPVGQETTAAEEVAAEPAPDGERAEEVAAEPAPDGERAAEAEDAEPAPEGERAGGEDLARDAEPAGESADEEAEPPSDPAATAPEDSDLGEQPEEPIADDAVDGAADDEDESGEPEPDYEILPLAEADFEDEDGDYEDDQPPAGFDKRPDVYNWILTPVTTLVVGPILAAVIGLFVGERATNYPRVCAPVRLANGCEETLLRLGAEHAVAFLFFWLLLWAMPWWRGLRAYRIGLAVVTALILIAVPLRLIASIQVGDTY
ncbi:hypothetical protein [Actinoplanes sp. NPDC051411]|uniref:hypothetical protein n=1 Tax=Actinoplanes sp. NPDC051411 TaxID=3155522 RepID=UPI0034252F0C